MPTYDYQCTACGHAWEMVQPMTASPIKACPACGKKSAKRLIGAGAALLFKGSGFYQTDYRTESYKKGAEADGKAASSDAKPAASAADGGSAAPAEPKPAVKAEAKAEKPIAKSETKKKPGKSEK